MNNFASLSNDYQINIHIFSNIKSRINYQIHLSNKLFHIYEIIGLIFVNVYFFHGSEEVGHLQAVCKGVVSGYVRLNFVKSWKT